MEEQAAADGRGGERETCVFAYSRHTLLSHQGSVAKEERAGGGRKTISVFGAGNEGFRFRFLAR